MIAAWKLPLIVSAIATSIVTGFYLGGPGLGMAVGFLAASSLVVMAIRNPPRPAIVPRRAGDGRERLLLVLAGPDDEATLATAAIEATGGDGGAEVLVLAPLRQRFLDRWACDTDHARRPHHRGRRRAPGQPIAPGSRGLVGFRAGPAGFS